MPYSFRAAAAALLLVGCAHAGARGPAPEGRQVRLSVPFFPDDTDQCGPSALASVLGFWGKPAAPAELKKEIYLSRLKGALTIDMLLAAQHHGLEAELSNGSLESVKKELDAGHPLIAFVNMGLRVYPIGHYMVITGYDDQNHQLLAHSGMQRDHRISYRSFEKRWKKTDRWTLTLLPKH